VDPEPYCEANLKSEREKVEKSGGVIWLVKARPENGRDGKCVLYFFDRKELEASPLGLLDKTLSVELGNNGDPKVSGSLSFEGSKSEEPPFFRFKDPQFTHHGVENWVPIGGGKWVTSTYGIDKVLTLMDATQTHAAGMEIRGIYHYYVERQSNSPINQIS
jgi:hypothetical protein